MEEGEIGNIKVKTKHSTWEFFTNLIWKMGVLGWVGLGGECWIALTNVKFAPHLV